MSEKVSHLKFKGGGKGKTHVIGMRSATQFILPATGTDPFPAGLRNTWDQTMS